MQVIISDDDRIRSWELLIDTVEKTDIPIEVVNGISLVFHEPVDGLEEQDIDFREFRADGFTDEDIEQIVHHIMSEYPGNIKTINFFLNVEYIAEIVQNQTNLILRKF